MDVARGTDQAALRGEQYAVADNLDARSAIYQYGSTSHSMVESVAVNLPFSLDGRRVLDVGCGPGSYSALAGATTDYVGIDLSDGMVAAARARHGVGSVAVADAQLLPFAEDSFDVVLAMHMLYHVPDRNLAVRELARVVRSDGVVVVASNGRDHHRERREVVHRAYLEVTGDEFTRRTVDENFLIEDAPAALGEHFTCETVALGDVLAVPNAEAVVTYTASIRSYIDLPEGPWQAFLDRVRELVEQEIATTGAFRITTDAGIVIARPR